MLTRVEATKRLLESYFDYLPSQYRSSLQVPSGQAASRFVPCLTCMQMRRVRRGRRYVLCPNCEGQGFVPRKRGEQAYDSYTGEQITQEAQEGPVRVMTYGEVCRELARVEFEIAQREGRIDSRDEFGWARKRRAMERAGDYEALEAAVLTAYQNHRREVRAAWHVYAHGWAFPNPDREDDAFQGLCHIASYMPSEPRVPSWLLPDPLAVKTSLWRGQTDRHEQQRGVRNEEIRRLVEEGIPLSKVGLRYNLSKMQVSRIVRAA